MEHEEPPPPETTDDPKPPPSTTTIPDEQQQQQTTKSYECNFCKRGFTNAQALGGHMNIHRKDKSVKTKSSSSSSTIPPHESPSPTRPRLSSAANPFSISHQGTRYSNPTIPPHDDDHDDDDDDDDKKKPLPLFSHRDTTTVNPTNIHQPSSPDRQVDLELRLGQVEPSESSPENKTAATTRNFF